MKNRCATFLIVSLGCLGCGVQPSGWRREPIPALEGSREITGWLSPSAVVTLDKDSRERAVSLDGQPAPQLPTLPPLGGLKPAPNRRFFSRSVPYPSPDGKWLLYWEQELQTGTDTTAPMGERWRLVNRADGKTQLWPPDGTLSRTPRPTLFMWNQEVAWLPDSSGWTVLYSANGPTEVLCVNALVAGPQTLPMPEKTVDTFIGQRRDGSWLWLPEHSGETRRLRILSTKSPAPAPLTIPDDLSATLGWPCALNVADDTLAVSVRRRGNWWNKLLKQQEINEIWVFPLTNGPAQSLPLPDKIAWVRSLHWSPDGKQLLCHLDSQTTPNDPMVSKTYLFSR